MENQTIYKVFWKRIPVVQNCDFNHIVCYVIDTQGNLNNNQITTKALESISDSVYQQKDWADCRGPFTRFIVEEAKIENNSETNTESESEYTLLEYLFHSQPEITKVSNIVIVSSSLDG